MKKRNILIASGLTLGVIAGATFGKIPVNVMNDMYIQERYAEASEISDLEVEWSTNIDSEIGVSKNIIKVNDGYICSYVRESFKTTSGNREYHYITQMDKISPNGEIIWEKKLDQEILNSIILVNDEIIGIGCNNEEDSGSTKNYIYKLDSDGNILCKKDCGSMAFDTVLLIKDGIIALGKDYIAKYDLNLDNIWNKNIDINNYYERTKERGIVLDDGFIYFTDAGVLFKYDFDGNEVWKNDEKPFRFDSVAKVKDGLIITGIYNANYGKIVKFNFNGNFLWEKTKDVYLSKTYCTSILALPDGILVDIGEDKLAKYDFDGNVICEYNSLSRTAEKLIFDKGEVIAFESYISRNYITKYINIINLDKSALDKLLEDVSKLTETDYSSSTWKDLQDAISGTEDLTTQEEIDAKVTEIQNALDNLDVDKSALDKLLEDISKLTETDYSSTSWQDLQDAITGVDTLTKQSEIDNKVEEIQGALDNLDVDRSALDKLLEDVSKLTETDYSSVSWEELQNAISGADTLTKQSEINSKIVEIQTALDNLGVDTSVLDKLLENISKLNETDYSSTSWEELQNAINDTDNLTKQSEIDSKVSEIQTALNNLGIDRSKLDDLLAEVDRLISTDYSTESWNKLQGAISNASTVITQAQVENAIKEITNAKNNLGVDRSELDRLIEESSKLNEKDYSSNSWKTLQDTLAGTDNLTKQSEINSKIVEIQTALDNLGVDKTKLSELLDRIDKMNKDIYTKDSLDSLMKVVDSVEEYTKQYEVDEKVAELEEALKNLKLDPDKVQIQKGDLDKNGIVNANDAAIALDLYKYGNVSDEELLIGDMDNNGIINANDAALILDIYKYGK